MTDRDAFAWFPILAAEHDDKAPGILENRGYTFKNGLYPPLPELGKRTTSSWKAVQLKS